MALYFSQSHFKFVAPPTFALQVVCFMRGAVSHELPPHPLSSVLVPLSDLRLLESPIAEVPAPFAQSEAFLAIISRLYRDLDSSPSVVHHVATTGVPLAWWKRWCSIVGLCPDHSDTHAFSVLLDMAAAAATDSSFDTLSTRLGTPFLRLPTAADNQAPQLTRYDLALSSPDPALGESGVFGPLPPPPPPPSLASSLGSSLDRSLSSAGVPSRAQLQSTSSSLAHSSASLSSTVPVSEGVVASNAPVPTAFTFPSTATAAATATTTAAASSAAVAVAVAEQARTRVLVAFASVAAAAAAVATATAAERSLAAVLACPCCKGSILARVVQIPASAQAPLSPSEAAAVTDGAAPQPPRTLAVVAEPAPSTYPSQNPRVEEGHQEQQRTRPEWHPHAWPDVTDSVLSAPTSPLGGDSAFPASVLGALRAKACPATCAAENAARVTLSLDFRSQGRTPPPSVLPLLSAAFAAPSACGPVIPGMPTIPSPPADAACAAPIVCTLLPGARPGLKWVPIAAAAALRKWFGCHGRVERAGIAVPLGRGAELNAQVAVLGHLERVWQLRPGPDPIPVALSLHTHSAPAGAAPLVASVALMAPSAPTVGALAVTALSGHGPARLWGLAPALPCAAAPTGAVGLPSAGAPVRCRYAISARLATSPKASPNVALEQCPRPVWSLLPRSAAAAPVEALAPQAALPLRYREPWPAAQGRWRGAPIRLPRAYAAAAAAARIKAAKQNAEANETQGDPLCVHLPLLYAKSVDISVMWLLVELPESSSSTAQRLVWPPPPIHPLASGQSSSASLVAAASASTNLPIAPGSLVDVRLPTGGWAAGAIIATRPGPQPLLLRALAVPDGHVAPAPWWAALPAVAAAGSRVPGAYTVLLCTSLACAAPFGSNSGTGLGIGTGFCAARRVRQLALAPGRPWGCEFGAASEMHDADGAAVATAAAVTAATASAAEAAAAVGAIDLAHATVSSVYPLTRPLAGSIVSLRGLAGLRNLGNTCFMSSTLQCLAHAPLIAPFLAAGAAAVRMVPARAGSGGRVAQALGGLLRAYAGSDALVSATGGVKAGVSNGVCASVLNPRAVKAAVARGHPMFRGTEQEDATEFLLALLDELHEDLRRRRVGFAVESPAAVEGPVTTDNPLACREKGGQASASEHKASTPLSASPVCESTRLTMSATELISSVAHAGNDSTVSSLAASVGVSAPTTVIQNAGPKPSTPESDHKAATPVTDTAKSKACPPVAPLAPHSFLSSSLTSSLAQSRPESILPPQAPQPTPSSTGPVIAGAAEVPVPSATESDDAAAAEAWASHVREGGSVISDCAHGLLRHQVRCPQCPGVSVRFEPFVILPLPVPPSPIKVEVIFAGRVPALHGAADDTTTGTQEDEGVARLSLSVCPDASASALRLAAAAALFPTLPLPERAAWAAEVALGVVSGHSLAAVIRPGSTVANAVSALEAVRASSASHAHAKGDLELGAVPELCMWHADGAAAPEAAVLRLRHCVPIQQAAYPAASVNADMLVPAGLPCPLVLPGARVGPVRACALRRAVRAAARPLLRGGWASEQLHQALPLQATADSIEEAACFEVALVVGNTTVWSSRDTAAPGTTTKRDEVRDLNGDESGDSRGEFHCICFPADEPCTCPCPACAPINLASLANSVPAPNAAPEVAGVDSLTVVLRWLQPAEGRRVLDALLAPLEPITPAPSPCASVASSLSADMPSSLPASNTAASALTVALDTRENSMICRLRAHASAHGLGYDRLLRSLPPLAPPAVPTPESVSLALALDLFARAEPLEGSARWHCCRCGLPQRALVSSLLWYAPDVLFISLKRFARGRRISSLVTYPRVGLDLGPYMRGPAAANAVYDLCGVACHSGGLNSGHYSAIVRHEATDRWFHTSDAAVTSVPPEATVTADAYILCYARRQTRRYARAAAVAALEGSPADRFPARLPPLPMPILIRTTVATVEENGQQAKKRVDWELEQATGLALPPLQRLE